MVKLVIYVCMTLECVLMLGYCRTFDDLNNDATSIEKPRFSESC